LCTFAAMVGVGIAGYRQAPVRVRRQVKWILFGVLVAYTPGLVNACLELLGITTPIALSLLRRVAPFAVPASILMAILWRDFLDIDRILSAAATLNIAVGGTVFFTLLTLPMFAGAAATVGIPAPFTYVAVAALSVGIL